MTAEELYNTLDNAKLDYEVVENFEGVRTISFEVDEDEEDEEEEQREWVGTIRMRSDLAGKCSVPASTTFSDYDTLDDDIFVTAEELEGAEQGDDPADPDDHPFCYVKLKDGRSLYFMSVDLDFKD